MLVFWQSVYFYRKVVKCLFYILAKENAMDTLESSVSLEAKAAALAKQAILNPEGNKDRSNIRFVK